MKIGVLVLSFLTCLQIFSLPSQAQSLAEIASKEQQRRARRGSSSRVYTNEDLSKYRAREEPNHHVSSTPSTTSAKDTSEPRDGQEERTWSRRFLEAKTRLQEAQNQQTILKTRLNDSHGMCGPETYYDTYYLFHSQRQLEKNKDAIAAAKQALEELREELRKSGKPVSWESSRLAVQPASGSADLDTPREKDRQYWQERLALIDKRYRAIISPLEAELFELVHRRPPKPGEDITIIGGLGTCIPRFVVDLDARIKALKRNREHERAALVEQARREGALPGWFR